jgi:hypothetical protein
MEGESVGGRDPRPSAAYRAMLRVLFFWDVPGPHNGLLHLSSLVQARHNCLLRAPVFTQARWISGKTLLNTMWKQEWKRLEKFTCICTHTCILYVIYMCVCVIKYLAYFPYVFLMSPHPTRSKCWGLWSLHPLLSKVLQVQMALCTDSCLICLSLPLHGGSLMHGNEMPALY